MTSRDPDVGVNSDSGVDPDVDIDAAERDERGRRELTVLATIALGGVVGAEARYGLAELAPHGDTAWPWSTLATNVAGSLLIGILMVLVVERRRPHDLVRPFLGVGVLGGFTTFSTFAVDLQHLLTAHRPYVALGYLLSSLLGCVAATALALSATRRLVPERRS